MARAHFVKKARKDHPAAGIKAGESYYWWAFMSGGRGGAKRFSKTPPKPSQLTQSEFWGAIYGLQESSQSVPDFDELESKRDSLVDELNDIKSETEDKLNNMPDGLRDGGSGQILQERVDSLDGSIGEIENVDISFQEPDVSDSAKEDREAEIESAKQDRATEIWDEITSHLDLGCS